MTPAAAKVFARQQQQLEPLPPPPTSPTLHVVQPQPQQPVRRHSIASTRLVVLGGTGDAYLICALAEAFRMHHGRTVEVVLKKKLVAIADLFPNITYSVDDAIVDHAEQNQAFQRSYDNQLFLNDTFYAHPSFTRSGVRVDQLTAKADTVSQADMYRMMLRLPPRTPLTLPVLPKVRVVPGTVLLLTEAVSWPNTQVKFWPKLFDELLLSGRVVTSHDKRWSLAELLVHCAASEWVIGPQCGVMSILVTGQFPCRKTLATPSIDGNLQPDLWPDDTYPYGYVTKFAGEDHDVEEFKITDSNHEDVVAAIADGVNASRFSSHDPAPVMTVEMPLTPGDFLDRLAVLTVKRARFEPVRRAALEREYQRYVEARGGLTLPPRVKALYARLEALHAEAYGVLERMVPSALGHGTLVLEDHVLVIRLNHERVEIKNAIDAACHAPYAEVKSYY